MAQELEYKYRLRYKHICWMKKDDPGEDIVCALLTKTDDVREAKEMGASEVFAAESDAFIVKDVVLEELKPNGVWEQIAKWPWDW